MGKKTTESKTATKTAPRKAGATEPKAESLQGTRTGVVDSDKRAKTRRVVVSYLAKHPKYGKYIRQRAMFQVHDENNESRTGDIVEIAQCRPVSATKTWRLVRVVERRSAEAAAIASVKEIQ